VHRKATTGHVVLAVSTFFGIGSQMDVNTGLVYDGCPVSPTFVSITAVDCTGRPFATSVNLHDADVLIDVAIEERNLPPPNHKVAWIGMAWYF